MGDVLDFNAVSSRRDQLADALALRDATRVRDACRRIAAAIDALTIVDGVRFGHELDAALVDELEMLAARLES